jgi:lipoprotein-anchoring transpeptidase ErfK/SrfK
MTHFVAFSHGERTGARVAFHSVPTLRDGTYVQPLDTVGQIGVRGESSGCIRVLPEDAVRIWEWIAVGDEVHVVT